mgnify:CR=1 FL=1
MSQEARITEIYTSVVSALKTIVVEHDVTEADLKVVGHFLDKMGKADLFTNILNVALSMTIVERRRAGANGTRPNLEGPYHVPGAPDKTAGTLYEKPLTPAADLLEWSGRLIDADTGAPLAEGAVDIWQANERGEYDHHGFHLRGVVRPDAEGRFVVRTIVPLDYSEHGDDPIGEMFEAMGRGSRRAAHLHVKAHAPGHAPLTTQLFVPWSDFLASDYVEGAVTPDLVLELKEGERRDGHRFFSTTYDIALQRGAA